MTEPITNFNVNSQETIKAWSKILWHHVRGQPLINNQPEECAEKLAEKLEIQDSNEEY